MRRAKYWLVAIGIALGLAASAVVLAVWPQGGMPETPRGRGSLLSDCDGPIRELVVHYMADASDTVGPIYREFLRQLPADVRVHVVCPRQEDFEHLKSQLGTESSRLSPVIVDHPMTCWSRDRWLAIRFANHREGSGIIELCTPRMEQTADTWPARSGDAQTANDLATVLGNGIRARRSALLFDGGDFVADNETVFVTPAV